MATEMTPQERAAVQYTMNDLFRMAMDGKVNIVEDKFVYASALQQTRRAALLEIADYAKRECCVQCADTDRWQKGHNVAALHIASVCEAKIRELGS